MSNKHSAKHSASDFISDIFAASRDMSDEEYCEFLEAISGALDDAVQAKREELEA